VDFIPETKAIGLTDGLGVFKFVVKNSGNKIMISSVIQFNKGQITPEYYEDLKGFYAQILKKYEEKIVLIKQ